MSAVFYAVGVGPGNPDLLTLKALQVIQTVDIIFAPGTQRAESTDISSQALRIVGQKIDLCAKQLHVVQFPMGKNVQKNALVYDSLVESVTAFLHGGQSVAFLCLGDITVYATAFVIEQRLHSAGFTTQIVPGVTSFCAGAAELHRSVVQHDESAIIIPGDAAYKNGTLGALLELPGKKIIMKSSRSIAAIIAELQMRGLAEKSAIAVNVGMGDEQLLFDSAVDAIQRAPYILDGKNYFSIIYVDG